MSITEKQKAISKMLILVHNKFCDPKLDENSGYISLFEYGATDKMDVANIMTPFIRLATRFEGIKTQIKTKEEKEEELMAIENELFVAIKILKDIKA